MTFLISNIFCAKTAKNFTLLLSIGWAMSALAQTPVPAQVPLLVKSGVGVPPNIMLTLDDSGSMQFQHMPEDKFAGGTFFTTNPVGSDQVRWDPFDNYQTGYLVGTVPGIRTSTNYVLKALRSPDTNTLFYNPEVWYQPWFTNDGVNRLPNSPVTGAYKDPLVRTGAAGTTIDLTRTISAALPATVNAGSFVIGQTYKITSRGPSNNRTNFTLIGATSSSVGTIFTATGVGSGGGNASTDLGWCFTISANYSGTGTGSGQGCEATNATFTHDPGVYFRLTKTGSTYNSVTDETKYTAYTINDLAATTYTKFAKRDDCITTAGVCTRTEERQNFANWFTYYRTRNLMARGAMMEAFGPSGNTFRLGFGRINKPDATVDGVNTTVIEDSSTYGGGGVRDFTASRKINLFKWLEDLPANNGTPLVTAMQAIGEYYSRIDARGPYTDDPSVSTNVIADNKTCRRSYNILVTDGYWNGAAVTVGNQDNTTGSAINGVGSSYTYSPSRPYSDGTSNTLADVAMKYWKTDLQPNMTNNVATAGDNNSFWQNMTNFTVGLGVRGTLDPAVDLPALSAGTKAWPAAASGQTAANIDDLWHAAVNSRGAYFSAKDPQELSLAIRTALTGATGTLGATAGVATASTILEATNRKYVPTYFPGSWSGDISAKPLDINGQAGSTVWSAAARMPAWAARNIVTWDNGLATPAAVSFDWATISAANRTALGAVATAYTTQFVDFLRGNHTNEGVGQPFRPRVDPSGTAFVLGDFVNSNPVLIKGSFNGSYHNLALGGASAYQNFLTAKAARTAVLFTGGNDGMLHGFKDTKAATAASSLTDGEEIFAYVPRAVYPNLYKLTDKTYGAALGHQFFVDGPQRESDAFVRTPAGAKDASGVAVSGTGPSWRNYLTGSLGAGGRAVYALDVTDTGSLGAASVRWELSSADDTDLGYVMAPIEVGVLPNGTWVAIFGNGFSSTNGYATLFVVNLETAAVTKLNVDTTGSNGLSGVTVQRDGNGQITNLYAGDLKGQLWKFNYDSSATSKFVINGGSALFTATNAQGVAQPISSAPAIFDHSLGGKIIVFGTGQLLTTTDQADASNQSVYGVWDKPSDGMSRPLGRSTMATRTLTAVAGTGAATTSTFYTLSGVSVDWITQRGWLIDTATALPGGRVIYPTQALSFNLGLVSLVAPVQGTPAVCDSGSGVGINLLVPVETGTNPAYHIFDTDGDGFNNGSDSFAVGYRTNADGIDSIVRSAGGDAASGLGSGGGSGGSGGDTGCEAGAYRVSLQNTTSQMGGCFEGKTTPPTVVPPTTPTTPVRQFDRVWRRIINPPIH